MTKKDYEKAAGIVRALGVNAESRAVVTAAFIALFSDDNPRFDKERFIIACVLR
jgi:hypothetical protein